jgi:spermidine/putrescine transport system substrate-binding protein
VSDTTGLGGEHDQPIIDPALLRGLTEGRYSRRQMLKAAGAGALGLSFSGFLAACGAAGTNPSGGGTTAAGGVGTAEWWAQQKKGGTFQFANWPYYMDISNHGKSHPSLHQFTEKTGIKVNYLEVIQNNDSFYAKIQPSLQGGQATGYDMIVMTNGWYLTELINHKWLIPLDLSLLPNFKKYASPIAKGPGYDPHNTYTIAWQSGFTGIGYDPNKIDTPPTSVQDLFNPKYKGHVGMMSDNTELGSLGLLALGINPATSTRADWQKAADKLKQQRPLVRQYYDQSYINALERGDIWITQAWSGDIFIANNSGYPDLKFAVPKEGVMHWTDNMAIPLHAEHPRDAIEYMNFVYDPKIAAELAAYINYITPVPAAKQFLLKTDPKLAKSPLIFPTSAMTAKAHDYYTFKNYDDFQAWNNTFNPIIQS